jgi:hypothetical protein
VPQIDKDKRLRRTVAIPGVVGETVVEISEAGIEFRARGTKLSVAARWPELVNCCTTPSNLPKRFENNPLTFLQHQASVQSTKRALRLTQKIVNEIAGINSSSGLGQTEPVAATATP